MRVVLIMASAKLLGLAGLSGLVLLMGYTIVFYRKRERQNAIEKEQLTQKIEQLKEKISALSVSSIEKRKELSLDKVKIEKAINNKLGESSWMILNLIFENPSLSNKEIAEEVSLSLEGVSSSLRRMYTAFDLKSASNKKITLIMKAVRISMEEDY